MAYEHILFEQRGRVGIVTLNRPERLNAWNDAMMSEMRDAVERSDADRSIGAIVFTGAGRAYCAGADISGWSQQMQEGGVVRGSATAGDDNWLAFLARIPTPTIAALNGPAGQQLGTDDDSVPKRLGPARYPVGIITGNSSINPILSLLIPGEDDGKVSIENARLQGMTDFLVVPHSHPLIMNSDRVIRQTSHFLRRGSFERAEQ